MFLNLAGAEGYSLYVPLGLESKTLHTFCKAKSFRANPGLGLRIPTQKKNSVESFGLSAIPLAGAEGLEPPNVGTKIRCLTTWRRPIK